MQPVTTNWHVSESNRARRIGPWAVRRLVYTLVEAGPAETWQLVRKNIAERVRRRVNARFDRKFNIETAGIVLLNQVTCPDDNRAYGIWYEPTPPRTLKFMFSLLPEDVSSFTFIDFGSGKGRTILYASAYKFRRIIGVEFARELHDVATKNIKIYKNVNQRCFDITSIHTDAADWALPAGDCVLYFFHPFTEEVMERVAKNIETSYRESPRKIIVLYYHPQVQNTFQRLWFLQKRLDVPMPFDWAAEHCIYRRRLAVYESV